MAINMEIKNGTTNPFHITILAYSQLPSDIKHCVLYHMMTESATATVSATAADQTDLWLQ